MSDVRIDFTVRVDDIFNRGHPARPREIAGLLTVLERLGCRLILNVIPRRLIESPNVGGEMVRALQDAVARGHEVIQHGYDHCCSQCGDTGHQTWCPLLGRDQPLEPMIAEMRRGKEMLEAVIGRKVLVYGPTGVDLHTETLLTAVRRVGYPATTGQPTEWHARLGLKVVETGSDYVFGAKTDAEWAEGEREAWAEFEAVVKRARETVGGTNRVGGYFQLLLHDPFTRAAYENGATLRYVERMVRRIQTYPAIKARNVVSLDVLGLTESDTTFGEPDNPTLYKRIPAP